MKKSFLAQALFLCLLAAQCTAQTALRFTVTDGKTNVPVLPQDITVQQSYTPATGNRPESWRFTVKNTSPSQRWLYLNWQTAWNAAPDIQKLQYWSGKAQPVTGAKLLQTPSANAMSNTTMLQALYDGQNGLALALPPDEIVSQLKQSLEQVNGKLALQLQIPLVLDAGQSDTFPIEVYRFTPRYGFLDALQKYFAAHPAAFKPRTNIDPRAAGVSGSRPWLSLAVGEEQGAFEETRRSGSDWEWFYAQFRRTGDIYVRDQFWDYKPARPFNAYRRLESAKVFRDTRHQNLKRIDATGAAPAFYVPAFLYAEDQLALQEYPGAIIRKPDGSYWRHYTTPWVTYSDNELLLYPWGNKFARQSMEDSRQLVEENDVPAFGYDIMAGGVPFRGEGLNESPRRAFDANGVYVDTAVGIAKIADYTRSLKKNGRETGLVGNATTQARPFLMTRSDSIMFEQAPYYYPEELTALRYTAGQKAITFWIAWNLKSLLNWEKMTPEQLREAFRKAADYTRLASYRYGAYPSASWRAGVPEITRMSARLKEVILQGWQAVPAVRGSNGDLPTFIWPARYGQGVGSFITLGNAEKKAWNGQVVIDNDYLGSANYLFIDTNGKALPQTVKGRTTIITAQIPSHETLVLRAVAAVPATAAGTATAQWKDNGASGSLDIRGNLTPTTVFSPRSWKPAKPDGSNRLFTSNYFATPSQALREFPFFDATNTAQIVIPEKPTADEQWAAQRLQDYFSFWGKKSLTPARDIQLPIIQGIGKSDTGKPRIVIDATAKTIRRQGDTLTVGGTSLRPAFLQFLAALDEKYFYTGVFPETGREAELMKKAGLTGKVLEP